MNMEEYSYYERSLGFDTKQNKDVSFTTAASDLYIDIKYRCLPIFSEWVLPQDSQEPQLLRRIPNPFTLTKNIRLNLNQLSNGEKAREIIGDSIQQWPVWVDVHQRLIDFALKKAREFVESMPPSHNAGCVNLRVRPEVRRIIDERLAIRSATWQSMIEAKASMVPAAESSIEALESMTLMESGSCTICLEEFVNGSEGVLMPCSHIFHGDCIKKWLRTSHCCPICRFSMPTN